MEEAFFKYRKAQMDLWLHLTSQARSWWLVLKRAAYIYISIHWSLIMRFPANQ
jgi:hypothetical protein